MMNMLVQTTGMWVLAAVLLVLNGELLINAFDLNDYGNFINSNTQPVIAKCSFNKKDKIRYLFLTELFDGSINISKLTKQTIL